MNKRYVDKLFKKKRIGKIIRYLQNNVWNLSDNNINYIFDKSYESKLYQIVIFMLEHFQKNKVVKFGYYDEHTEHNDKYTLEDLCDENNHYELLSYYSKKYNNSEKLICEPECHYPNINMLKYIVNECVYDSKLGYDINDIYLEFCYNYSDKNCTINNYFVKFLKYMMNPRLFSMYPLSCDESHMILKKIQFFNDVKLLSYLFTPNIYDIFPIFNPVDVVLSSPNI